MQWPNEKGQNDKQWSTKNLHRRKLKIEQHESNLKLGLIRQSGCTKYLNATKICRKSLKIVRKNVFSLFNNLFICHS
jgi:hypothetical protein